MSTVTATRTSSPPSIDNAFGLRLLLADIDGDTDLDLLVNGDTVRWFERLGGGFGAENPILSDGYAVPLDLDGDGDLDFIVTDPLAHQLLGIENLGPGSLGPRRSCW